MDKILVVDDEMINLMMVRRILESDYEVLTSQSAEDALEYLETELPSLILLDIHMPGMSGLEMLERLHHNDRFLGVPVIFLTANDDINAEIRGFELGADDFIKKPFVSAVVKRRVERCIDMYHLHRNMQEEIQRQTEKAEKRRKEVELLSREIIQALATAIDAKDIYTKGHSSRVADYSAILAKHLGWSDAQVERLHYKALLHDVGKIGVPDRVLNKNGRLTDEEFAVIKSHTTIGAEILKPVSSLKTIYEVARYHHERYDGKGYPDGLAGEAIPAEARVVGIADSYDAMSSDRVYRKALPKEVIREELIKGRGTQFDPDMLNVFLSLFDDGLLDESGDENADKAGIDLAVMLKNLLSENAVDGAMKLENNELNKVYQYIDSANQRYGIEYNTIMITVGWEGEVSQNSIDKAMEAMEYSIVQSLRKVDIFTRVADNRFLLVLTAAREENIKIIVERIFTGFYRNCQNVKFKPTYEVK